MSDVIFDEVDGLVVGTYAGPVRDDGGDRLRVQITLGGPARSCGFVSLSMEELERLTLRLLATLGEATRSRPR
ncbi:MAG TPA: hypothetical protein VGN14_14345 [Candidatus Elarobacter sp.]